MPSSSSSCRMTKYMSAQPTMKPRTIPISSLEETLTGLSLGGDHLDPMSVLP